jgi:hypothetical protein
VERIGLGWAALGAAMLVAIPAGAAGDESSLHDLIGVLKERGVLGEADYEAIAAKNAAWEAQQAEDSKPALSFYGDLRTRYEGFLYDEDSTGSERTNRHRGRYRLRLGANAEINERATVVMRFASGDGDLRSTNQTLGSGVDFDKDQIRIDLAYAHVSPFAHDRLGESGRLAFEIGKVPNPYVWKQGKDFMLWDHDISLEGASLLSSVEIAAGLEAFLSGGYYVLDENSTSKDPHLWAVQAGFLAAPAESVTLGGRVSYFNFGSLDPDFHARTVDGTGGSTAGGGNIADGLSGSVGNQDVQVIEAAAYLGLLGGTSWPVLLYASYANNLTAEASDLFPTLEDEEDTAWGAGVELGDKKKYVMLGVGYWHIEANAFPSQFIDSDLFDGVTNREGFAVYGSRTILKNTDLNLTVFVSDEIETALPAFADSVSDADRVRLQADIVFSFK